MKKRFIWLSLIAASALWGGQEIKKVIAGDPVLGSRTVQYHNADVVSVSTEIRFSTLIQLPAAESIVEVTCGDKDFWQINWRANLAYVKPSKQDSKTNINIITASGNVYSFLLSEVSEMGGAHADLKLFVNPTDEGSIVAMQSKPKFIPASDVATYQQEAQQARAELDTARAAMKKELADKEAVMQADVLENIKHSYTWDRDLKTAAVFGLRSIYNFKGFTYIEATPEEAPAIYEIKDGKDSLIQFELRDGRYVIPKVLDQGYMRVGKAKLKFSKEG